MTLDPALQLALQSGLALLFASAARHKLRDLARFRAAVASYEILPPPVVPVAAIAFPAFEGLLAIAIASAAVLPLAAPAAAALLGVYATAIMLGIRRGRTEIDCGCSGPAAKVPLQPALVVRNVILAAAALLLALPASSRPLTALDLAVVAFATAALVILWHASERLLALSPRAAAMRAQSRRAR